MRAYIALVKSCAATTSVPEIWTVSARGLKDARRRLARATGAPAEYLLVNPVDPGPRRHWSVR